MGKDKLKSHLACNSQFHYMQVFVVRWLHISSFLQLENRYFVQFQVESQRNSNTIRCKRLCRIHLIK